MAVTKLSAKQPWTAVWTPGVNLANFYNLYDSKGDVTISVATSIPTTLDGPIQVARYGALTVNAALTASQRCRGLIVLSESLSVGAAGSISMTARGAAGAKNWAVDKDIFVPQSITFSGKNTSYADFLKWIRQTGYCIFDPSLYACPPPGMGDVTCDWATWMPFGSTIISAAGCGARLGGLGGAGGSGTTIAGATGNAGTNGGTGGGGRGCYYYSPGFGGCGHQYSGAGRTWGGGTGGGSTVDDGAPSGLAADQYGGNGGWSYGAGAGNPAGDGTASGTGGILISICRGNVSIASGASLTASGVAATAGYAYSGGSSGGGSVSLFYGGSYVNNGTIAAPGGSYGNGGAGGAGSVTSKSLSTMGWS